MPHRSLSPSKGVVEIQPLESRRLLALIPGFSESAVASGLNRPVQMAFAPDGRLFVTQQSGELRVIKDGQLLATPFLQVAAQNRGERGLLGVTFDPDFASNSFIYVYYTTADNAGGYVNRVSRFVANGDTAVAGSETVLIETDPLGTGTWHNAGGMKFGADGKLYIGVGENQQNIVAQDLGSMFGKVLRINSDGSIPSDNPFVNQVSGKYQAIFALGFRNPYTLDVQPGTGRIFVNDVGAANWEEINELKPGANYGWPGSEGPTSDPVLTNPFYAYPHAGGDFDNSAITGAAFYNPQSVSFPADYVGDFFFGDYGLGTVQRIDVNTKEVSAFATGLTEVTDVEVGPDGSLYYTSRAAGKIFRVQAVTVGEPPTPPTTPPPPPSPPAPPSLTADPQSQSVSAGQPVTFSVSAEGDGLTYQWLRNGSILAGATAADYTLPYAPASENGSRFSVRVSNAFGSITSQEAFLTVLTGQAPVGGIMGPMPEWVGGGELSYYGFGFDAQDGDLPASALTWEVELMHDTHAHPFIAPYSGEKSDVITLPDTGHTEHNIWIRIHLTLRDSQGLTHSTFVDVMPRKVQLTLATEPAGIPLLLDGSPVPAGFTSPAVVGMKFGLGAPETQIIDGVPYQFTGWSDGGAASHEIKVPNADATYVARYAPAAGTPPPTPASSPITALLSPKTSTLEPNEVSPSANFVDAVFLVDTALRKDQRDASPTLHRQDVPHVHSDRR